MLHPQVKNSSTYYYKQCNNCIVFYKNNKTIWQLKEMDLRHTNLRSKAMPAKQCDWTTFTPMPSITL